jgi:hypothetical protein
MPVAGMPAGGEGHQHGAVHLTATGATVTAAGGAIALISSHDLSAAPAGVVELASSNHGQHSENTIKLDTSSKLVPKPCTVTASGGVLVTSVDGKRQCDCNAKAAAAKAIKEQILGSDEADVSRSPAALADCLPCQRSAVSADAAVCSFVALDAEHPLNMLALPIMEHLDGESCPEKSAAADAERQAADAEFLHGLQIVGFSLLAASVALLPTLRWNAPRKRDDEFEPAADWLFGRLNVELLVR